MNNLSNEGYTEFWISVIGFLDEYSGWLVSLSLLSFLITLLLVPVMITRIPADYFCHHHRLHIIERHPLLGFVIKFFKNMIAMVFFVTGMLLLFLPGQGLILIFVGMIIMDYPGKYVLERWFIKRKNVLPILNAIRARYGVMPLRSP